MPVTFLKAKVINPEQPKKSEECEFLVDSGAVCSVVPQSILKKLGIKPTSSQEFILANGEVIKKPVGNAYFGHGSEQGNTFLYPTSCHVRRNSCFDRLL